MEISCEIWGHFQIECCDYRQTSGSHLISSSKALMQIWACFIAEIFMHCFHRSLFPQCIGPLCHSRSSVRWSHCKSIWMLWIDHCSCCGSIFTPWGGVCGGHLHRRDRQPEEKLRELKEVRQQETIGDLNRRRRDGWRSRRRRRSS